MHNKQIFTNFFIYRQTGKQTKQKKKDSLHQTGANQAAKEHVPEDQSKIAKSVQFALNCTIYIYISKIFMVIRDPIAKF